MEIFSLVFRYVTAPQNRGIAGGAMVGGWILSIRLLLDHSGVWSFINAEFFVKTTVGLIIAGVSGFITVLCKDIYIIKFKPKIFKNGSRSKNQKRA